MPTIDLEKGKSKSEDFRQEENTQAMQAAIDEFFKHLMVKHNEFSQENASQILLRQR